VANVYVLNPAGVVRFATDGAAEGKAFADAAGEAVRPARPGTTSTLRHTPAGHTVLRSVNPVMNEPRCQQCHGSVQANPVNGLLVVDYAADDVVRDYWRAGLLLAAAGFAVLLAALGTIMSAIKRNVLVPVASIGVAANRFAAGDLEARTPATGSDELSVLAGQFNAMAEQVGRNVRAVQVNERFLQDVLDAVPDGMRVIGPDYRILKANAAYLCNWARHQHTAWATLSSLQSQTESALLANTRPLPHGRVAGRKAEPQMPPPPCARRRQRTLRRSLRRPRPA
jgi:HAMP domain-containing protein